MCHHGYLWGLCPSRSDGGTGSQFGKWMGSTTTSTPSWKVLFVLEEKQNYGKNAHLYVWVTSKSAFLNCLDCVSASNWVTPHWLSRNVYFIVCVRMPHCRHVSGVIQTFSSPSSLFMFQHISQWTAFSGRGRDAPGCAAGGGGGRIVVELWQHQEVTRWDWTYLHTAWGQRKDSSRKMKDFFFFFS